MRYPLARKIARPLRRTPLHPQFLLFRRERSWLATAVASAHGKVLDIGCGRKRLLPYLPEGARYFGLDTLTTGASWYGAKPELFGDAGSLPVAEGSLDHVLLLDVLEHLPEPEECLRQVRRALAEGGTVTIQVPFLYPVHDAPYDFQRWTAAGLRRLAERLEFEVIEEQPLAGRVESAALLVSLAASGAALGGGLGYALLPLLPFVVVVSNVVGWLGALLGGHEESFTSAYRVRWRPASSNASRSAATTS